MTAAAVHPELLLNQYSWTIDKYHRLIEHGILTENDRVELVLGKIVAMSPIGKMHAACITKLNKLLYSRFINTYELRSENPITLPHDSEPEPDYVIAKLKDDSYRSGHPVPADILLIIEVSDRTLSTDRELKSYLYASAAIPEYWIINLIDLQLERYTLPQADGTYKQQEVFGEKEYFTSSILGNIKVTDILP